MAAGPGVTRAMWLWNALIIMMMTKISIIDQRPMDSVMRYCSDSTRIGRNSPKRALASNTSIETIFSVGTAMLAEKIMLAMSLSPSFHI